MNFNFGSPAKTTGGFTLGSTTITPVSTSTPGFTLGGGDATASKLAQPPGLMPAASSGLGLQQKTPATAAIAPTPSSTSFSLTPSSTQNLFSLPTASTTAGATTTGFSLSTPAAGTGFSLGTPGTGSAGLSLTAPTTTSGFTVAAPSTGIGFSLTPASTSAGGFSLSTAPTSTGFSLAPASISAGFSLSLSSTTNITSTTATTLATSSTSQIALATSTVVSSAPSGASTSINFVQLEESINKWTLDLEEQEKVFMNQATQVNAWDRLLINNGEKIVGLNSAVERVKLEQQQLDHELDFILAQQRELEDCIAPLEKELANSGVTDPEREQIYTLAENMDSQLKQMSEDLKEIIEHLNEANRMQDANDPIVQIGRILNAHMNSLQWIDKNITVIGSNLEQVSKLHDFYRRENERSFHLTYD